MRQANSDTYSPLLGVLVHQTTCTIKRLGWGGVEGCGRNASRARWQHLSALYYVATSLA
jgi:hypothetical protein